MTPKNLESRTKALAKKILWSGILDLKETVKDILFGAGTFVFILGGFVALVFMFVQIVKEAMAILGGV